MKNNKTESLRCSMAELCTLAGFSRATGFRKLAGGMLPTPVARRHGALQFSRAEVVAWAASGQLKPDRYRELRDATDETFNVINGWSGAVFLTQAGVGGAHAPVLACEMQELLILLGVWAAETRVVTNNVF